MCEEMKREGECEVPEGERGQEQGERGLKREEGAQHRGRETTKEERPTVEAAPLSSPCKHCAVPGRAGF